MRLDWTTFALQLINFTILVWLLQRFLYRPVLRVIDARRQAADTRYSEAQRTAESAKRQLEELQAQRAAVGAERAAALAEAREQARQLAETRRAEAEQDAKALLEEARQTLARERETLLAEARSTALDIAAGMAGRVLAEIPESLRIAGWLERIDEHVRSLPAAEKAELAGELAAGAPLRVMSAWSLPPEIEQRWRAQLRETFGTDAAIDFETDAALIGGAELRFPHATLSFSVKSVVSALKEEAERHDEPH
ncbi:MAG: F0F1 ATP synthase subunit delta [Gammaproteobacteria bacterium]|nr:F0F1 ATP synthase subunit delta [Gammaproteobacteria bacterium]MDE2263446.1 F0F1 ATP synthase subunit delta [Gammaproteobacteria bacterium]